MNAGARDSASSGGADRPDGRGRGRRAADDALVDALVAVADDLDIDATLRRTVRMARELTGAAYAALGVLDEHGESLAQFVHEGLDEATADRIGHLPTGRGLLGAVIRDPRPLRVADVATHPASVPLPPAHPPVEGFLGVPVRVAGEVFGNLYLTGKPGGFTGRDERVLVALAAVAGTAIRNAGAAARLAARELLQRALADLATAALTGADAAELLLTIEVAGAEMLPGSTASIVPAAAAGRTGEDEWGFRVGEEHALVVDHADVSPWRLTDEARQAIATLCRQAGVALGWAAARVEVRRLAIAGERDRIARDLHDTVVQRLFGAGLQLDALTRRASQDVAEAVERVIGEVDAAIGDLRTTIGQLDSPAPLELRDRLEAVVAALAPACPGLTELVVQGELTDVPDDVVEDVPAVLREGIANAARHAGAATIVPRVAVDDVVVEVTVTDDGIGPGQRPSVTTPGPGATSSLGLRNLTARAARHGGTCTLEPVDAGGSRLVWRVPVG